MDRTPYEVIPYSVNALCSIVEWVTKSPFHHAKQKRQISYIDSFLSHWPDQDETLKGKLPTMVIEGNYIDSHYLDEYSQYFVKCFNKYPRDCCRIHFFIGSEFKHQVFKELLHSPLSQTEREKILGKYLGYLVIRPLPETFIAKACLRPYPQFSTAALQSSQKIITRTYKSSLFGIPLSVDSVAFQEQDRVLSACATSALWSFFHAHNCISLNNLPSAIAITNSAYPDNPGSESIFPNAGLTNEMICRSIRENKLEARLVPIDTAAKDCLFLEEIYAYCTADIPLILGVDVIDDRPLLVPLLRAKKKENFHAVTILGYGMDDDSEKPELSFSSPIRIRANRISKLYIHDDRTGPYARLMLEKRKWKLKIDREVASITFLPEEYRPTHLIAGVYHKIRIHYPSVRQTCASLSNRLKSIVFAQPNIPRQMINVIESLEWDIRLFEISRLKEEILNQSSNLDGKIEFLAKSMPRFVWSAKTRIGDQPYFQLFFDATDIPQGDAFLGAIHYDKQSLALFKIFEIYCVNQFHVFQNPQRKRDVPPDHLWGIVSYYIKKQNYSEVLTKLFGEPKYPIRIKDHETDHDVVTDQGRRITTREEAKKFILEPEIEAKGLKYIWVIDLDGILVIGTEDQRSNAVKNGHPTLLRGAPGRIAGELHFDPGQKIWLVNSYSGRYSERYSPSEINRYLRNAVNERFELYFGPDSIFEIVPKDI